MKKFFLLFCLLFCATCLFAGAFSVAFDANLSSYNWHTYTYDNYSKSYQKSNLSELCATHFYGVNLGYSGKFTDKLSGYGELGVGTGDCPTFLVSLKTGIAFSPSFKNFSLELGLGPMLRFSYYAELMGAVGITSRLQINLPLKERVSCFFNLSPGFDFTEWGNRSNRVYNSGDYCYYDMHSRFSIDALIGVKVEI